MSRHGVENLDLRRSGSNRRREPLLSSRFLKTAHPMLHKLSVTTGGMPPQVRLRGTQAATVVTTGVYAVLGGMVTLVGWAFDIPRLTDFYYGGISMFPNAAICAIAGGVVLLLLAGKGAGRWYFTAARAAAAFVAIVGGLTLLEHISSLSFGIDTLLFERSWGQRAAAAPMQMGPPASMSYAILGTGLLLATCGPRPRKIAGGLAILPVAIASLSLIGYWFGVDQLFGVVRLTGIALQTSTMIAALAIGLLAAVPEHGLIALLRSKDAGGMLARKLLLPIILIPLVLGWFRILGQEAGYVARAVAEKRDFQLDFRLRPDNGEVLWLHTRAHVECDAQGEPLRVIGTVTDVTERKRADEAIRDADRRKDEFLALLAHELRNPLAPLHTAAQLLQLECPAEPMLIEARDIIDRQLQTLVRLVDDLLDVSRVSQGKLQLRKERIELRTVVERALETSRPHVQAAGHELTVSLPPQPVYLDADPVRLAQVLSNLLNNACKYTEDGGHVSLLAEQDGTDVVVRVRDTGIGIAPEDLSGLFKIFSQVASTAERSKGGLGIGLSLVRDLVSMHDGTVQARSDGPGKGSEFIVRLPASASSADSQSPPVEIGGTDAATAARQPLVG